MDRTRPATAQNAPGQENVDNQNVEKRNVEHAGGAPAPDDQIVQRAIGAQLRAVYDEVVRLPVPDRFLSLLSSLDNAPGGTKTDGAQTDGGADK